MRIVLAFIGGVAGLGVGPVIFWFLFREASAFQLVQGPPGDGALFGTIILSLLFGVSGFFIVMEATDEDSRER